MPSIKCFIVLFIVFLISPAAFAAVGLTPASGTPSCGAIQDGQDLCGTGPAIFESNAIGVCPEGTFADVGRWGCYTCPAGYDRGIAAVDSDRACTRVKTNDQLAPFVSAKQVGTACPAGSFFDPVRGGECFSCPSGYVRSAAHIDWADACVILPKEVFSRVTEHGKAFGPLGLDCGRELIFLDEPPFIIQGPVQFWDGIDGNCHSCPTDYSRTGYSVHDSRACSKVISGAQSKATIRGQAQCLDGEIADFLTNPEQGGNCYTCPAGYDRTLFSINSAEACETTPEYEFSVAIKTTDLTCPANQIFDFISTRHPDVQAKLFADGVPSDTYELDDLGTCWTCPPGATRSWSSVTANDACVLADVGWNMPTYRHVGLFGLQGATEVILAIINERNDINELAIAYADSTDGLSRDEFVDDVWQEISESPEESSILALVAYARLQSYATKSTLKPHEQAFLQDFQKQVTDYRSAMAQEALNILDVWQEGAALRYIDPRFNNRPEVVAQKLFWLSIGVVAPPISPPDFSALIYEFADTPEVDPLVLALTAAERSIDQGTLTTLMPNNAFGEIATQIEGIILDKALTAAQDAIIDEIERQILIKAQSAGVKASAKMLIFGPSTLGPQIAIALFIEYATQWVDFIAGATDAEPKLLANLAQAQQLYSVSRQLETIPGVEDLGFHYKTIMNSSVPPSAADKLRIQLAVADTDGDSVIDTEDDFPNNVAAAIDTDADGQPDSYNPGCDAACISESGLVLDLDDDNDGINDADDVFPLIAIGDLLDTDNDGAPDQCNDACMALGMAADTETVPQAPVITSVEGDDSALMVRFSPNGDGGFSIIDYTLSCGAGSLSQTKEQSPIRISELENGLVYACSVTARNLLGNSAASESVSGTPQEMIRSELNIPLLKAILDAKSARQLVDEDQN